MIRLWAIAAIAILAACTSAEKPTEVDSEILGVWEMVSFTMDGIETPVHKDVNSASIPYVTFELEIMSGDAGCNGFGTGEDGYTFVGGVLKPSETIFTAAECSPESLMTAETALQDMLWSERPIGVNFEDLFMVWFQGEEKITWEARDAAPPPPTIPPQTTVGDLDCGDDVVVTRDVPSEGTTAGEIAREADSSVIEVEEDGKGLRATGYDSAGTAVVVVNFQDADPFPFRIYTCP